MRASTSTDVDVLCVRLACAASGRVRVLSIEQVIRAPEDAFYGSRTCKISDPFGYVWSLMTFQKEVSIAEMQAFMDKMAG